MGRIRGLSEDFLRSQLRTLRSKRNITVGELAAKLQCSKSWISKIENGQLNVSEEYVERFCKALNLEGIERETLFDIDAWNASDPTALKRITERIKQYQDRAKKIWVYNPVYLPCYVQTFNYTRSILQGVHIDPEGPVDTSSPLSVRESVKNSIGDKKLTLIVTEQSLYMAFFNAQVMEEQIAYLVRLCEEDEIDISILPFGARTVVNFLYDINIYDDEVIISETFFDLVPEKLTARRA